MVLKTRAGWIGLTVILCLVWALLGWFAYYSPKLDEISSLKEDTTSAKIANDELQVKVAKLGQQFTHIDEYRAAVASARTRLPADIALSSALDEIDAAAQRAGVVISDYEVDSGKDVDVTATGSGGSPKVPQAPASSSSSTSADGGAAAKDATAAKPVVVAVPITLTVYGSYQATTSFVDLLQAKSARYVLVSTVQLTALAASEAAGPTPEVKDGDLMTVLQTFIFTYPDGQAGGSSAETGDASAAADPNGSDESEMAQLPRLKGDAQIFGVEPPEKASKK